MSLIVALVRGSCREVWSSGRSGSRGVSGISTMSAVLPSGDPLALTATGLLAGLVLDWGTPGSSTDIHSSPPAPGCPNSTK